MNFVSLIIALLTGVIHLLGRGFYIFDQSSHGHGMLSSMEIEQQFSFVLSLLLALPAVLFAAAIVFYMRQPEHPLIPLLHTLTLTFGSISMIAGAGGHIEFHFSIFMVIAALSYYKNIRLIILMTVIFALQHVLGFALFPEIVFGTSIYPFKMLLLHAIFLVLTSLATSLQIHSTLKIESELIKEQQNQRTLIMDEITSKLSTTAGQLLQTATQLSGQSGHSSAISDRLGSIVQEMAAGAEKHRKVMESNNTIIGELSAGVRSVNTSASDAAAASEQSWRQAEAGSSLIGSMATKMEKTGHSIADSHHAVQELNRQMQKIDAVLQVVWGIADQTKLLSLNASTESARAGEAGRGFAVIAAEIRKLSEQSASSVGDITAIVASIQKQANELLTVMDVVRLHAAATLELTDEAKVSFESIQATVKHTAGQIREISAAMQELHAGSDLMDHSVRDMKVFTKDTSDHSRMIVQTFDEHFQSIRQVTDAAAVMSGLAEELNMVIGRLREQEVSLESPK